MLRSQQPVRTQSENRRAWNLAEFILSCACILCSTKMLLPLVDIPPSASVNEASTAALLTFVSHIGILGPVLLRVGDVSTENENLALQLLEVVTSATPCCIDGLSIDGDELATKLLDKGALVVFFKSSAEIELQSKVLKSFPRTRVGLNCADEAISVVTMLETVDRFREYSGHFLFRLPPMKEESVIAEIKKAAKTAALLGPDTVQISFIMPSDATEFQASAIASSCERLNAVFYPRIVSPSDPPVEMRTPSPCRPTHESAAELEYVDAFIGCLCSDRIDMLYTTVVCDDHGVCLGLVYSNVLSIRSAVTERRGIYWSRSRGGLWRKGDTSGMHQELLSIQFDCDGDALRFSVIQHGTPGCFCHLMTRTCWGHGHGIQHLQDVLTDRKINAPQGSYTKRLFEDPDLLQKKLLEEVQELVEATEPDHVAAEAADVMYFMMTRCVAAGVGLREIEGHLNKRSLKVTRRPGNAKAWRSENAAQILQGDTKNEK